MAAPGKEMVPAQEQDIEIIPPDRLSVHEAAAYTKNILAKAFEDFGLGRDMIIGTVISLATLGLQVWKHLIPLADWQEHKMWWILSFILPYVVILGGHALWRLATAPVRLHKLQYNEHQAEIASNEARQEELVAGLEQRIGSLDSELSKIKQPDVALVWDWGVSETERQIKQAHGYTEKDILIHNRSSQYIYNVQIQPIRLTPELVFDPINDVAPNGQHLARGRWDGRSTETKNYIYYFAVVEQEIVDKGWMHQKLHNRGISDKFSKVPMTVTYESTGVKWQYDFEFNYDPGGDETCFVRLSGQRL